MALSTASAEEVASPAKSSRSTDSNRPFSAHNGSSVPISYWEQSQRVNQPHQQEATFRSDSRTQLFVSNLPFRVRWQDLKDLFRRCGDVLRADVALSPENRSKGFGTVLFAQEGDAFRAMDAFNGFAWQGRMLDVRLDQQDPAGAIAMALANQQPIQGHWGPVPMQIPYQPSPAMSHNSAPSSMPHAAYLGSSNAVEPHSISRPASAASVGLLRSTSAAKEVKKALQAQSHTSSDDLRSDTNVQAPSTPSAYSDFGPNAPPFIPYAQYAPQQNQMMPVFMSQAAPFYPVPFAYHGPQAINGGLMGFHHAQNHHNRHHLPPGISNRHLFVGNLPFNCQWQDLKDLFRSAGNILRADINMGPDGRSRGYGTVLYATPEDAIRAVEMFDGFEYSGRALKVHFDKYPHHQHNGPPAGTHPMQMQMGQPMDFMQEALRPSSSSSRTDSVAHDRSYTNSSNQTSIVSESSLRNQMLTTPELAGSATFGGMKSDVDLKTPEQTSNAASDANLSTPITQQGRHGPGPLHFQQSFFSTGPAALMSPQPGGPPNLNSNGMFAMSPQTARLNLTPSMPGFSFHPFPQTPPLMPQFLSPGAGPFSPPAIHSNYNRAPGAPLHFQHAVHSPGTPGFSSMLSRGYFPSLDGFHAFEAPQVPQEQDLAASESSSTVGGSTLVVPAVDEILDSKPEDEAGYFPPVASLLTRRASTNSGRPSPKLALGSPRGSPNLTARSVSSSATKPTFDASADMTRRLAELDLRHLVQDDSAPKSPRRASFFGETKAAPEKGTNAALQVDAAAVSRRASFEASAMSQGKIEFGRSIWS